MIVRGMVLAAAFSSVLAAQTPGTLNLYPAGTPGQNPAQEQAELAQALTAANGSTVEITRVLEQYLAKYPASAQRALIEQSLYKNAADTGDRARIIRYGEKLLTGKPDDEMNVLDHVGRALIASDDADSAKSALAYAKRYEADIAESFGKNPEGHATVAQWADLASRARSRALFIEARAKGNLGDSAGALAAASASWSECPSAEAARERARWLVKLGREAEAVDAFNTAATVEDAQASWDQRDHDRKSAAALYSKIHGSEQGFGDLLLKAWDSSAAAMTARTARFHAMDSNYGVSDPFGFHLTGVGKTPPLDMASLKGKTLVVDFWATWCLPCQAQHPILQRLEQKYAATPDVVFLSLDADDDHAAVEPFLQQQKWTERVYLEGGLASILGLTSLPTVLVVDSAGKVHSRMLGFLGDSFEAALAARIEESRAK